MVFKINSHNTEALFYSKEYVWENIEYEQH